MHPIRTSVFIPARTPLVDLEPTLAVLHRFIQRGWVEGAVLDVADYRHVPDGPGVVLIGHDVDYGVEVDGLRMIRKRSVADDAGTQVADLLRMAAGLIEAFDYDGTVTLDLDLSAAVVEIRDRALGATAEDLAAAVTPALVEVYGEGTTVAAGTAGDPRSAPTAVVTTGPVTATSLLERTGGSRAPQQSPYDITVERFAELRAQDGVVVVDVREEGEYETVNLGGTLHPLAGLGDTLSSLDASATIVVHCRAGLRGAKAVTLLRETGFADAWNVNGGLVAWADRIDPTTVRY